MKYTYKICIKTNKTKEKVNGKLQSTFQEKGKRVISTSSMEIV